MASDIAVIEELEQKLVESELNFKELFEMVNDVIFIFDTKGKITSVNKSFERMVGYPREMYIGKSLVSLINEDYLGQMLDLFPRVLQNGETVSGEVGFATKSGKLRYVAFTCKPTYSEGRVAGILAVAKDITRLKKLEEIIQADKQLIGEVIDSVKGNLVLTDLEGNIKLANKTFLETFCYKKDDLMGRSTYHIFPIKSADVKKYDGIINDILTEDKANPIEMEVAAGDGRKLYITLSASIIKNTQGKPANILIQVETN